MNIDNRTKELLIEIAPAPLAATGALYLSSGVQFVYAMPIIAATSAIVFVATRRMRDKTEERRSANDFASSLERAYESMTTRGISLLAALGGMNHPKLGQVRKRIALGEDAGRAFDAEKRSDNVDISQSMKSILNEYTNNTEIASSLKASSQNISRARLVRKEAAVASTQKYVALSMVSSTIVPSLMTFGFVGYTIVNNSYSALLLFSVLMLAVLPCITTLIRVRINELFE